ncbi:BREX-2 system phosphatase PglZ [Streptomyces sp. NBC_00963]|uniref:BREX-2 system phosphatase PglZ n=1 Tax=Streptomyces sp. NBC_00963 TaxID=2903697 RepID=UPI003862F156|nr:BREX-2 system phosphatase PglZ [Streptomyces sp. NBC_00963]
MSTHRTSSTASQERPRPRPAHPAAVVQVLEARSFAEGEPRTVLIRAEPRWTGPERIPLSRGRTARVTAAVSPLALLDALGNSPSDDGREVLAVLTDADEADLGPGLLARVYRNRIHPIEPWAVVRRLFGVNEVDPRLLSESWAAEALVDAAGQEDWPRTPGTVLTRDTALSRLTAARLSTATYRLDPAGLDTGALLAWSLTPGAAERLTALRRRERQGLAEWLAAPERVGRRAAHALTALFALFDGGSGADAVPVGLLCAALWGENVPATADRARGRTELLFGGPRLDDDTLKAFGDETDAYVRNLLAGRSRSGEGNGPDPQSLVARADALARTLGAEEAAAASNLLEAGLLARYGAVARALTRCVPVAPAHVPDPRRIRELRETVSALAEHVLVGRGDHPTSLERLRMAHRLVHWLTTEPPGPYSTTAGAVQQHIDDSGWADLALGWIDDGDHAHPALPAALAALSAAVRARRHHMDEYFADRLTTETRNGAAPEEALVVEDFVRRVLAPVVKQSRTKAGGPPLLLVVLDGASAAVTADLAEQLRDRSWAEYDPVTDTATTQRRRSMLAALPTITRISRGSLFAGELTEIDQQEERNRFAAHRFWGGADVRLFHKNELRGQAGHGLGTDLAEALADPTTHVAVVVNTIDDRLREDRAVSHWALDELLGMRELLALARVSGRALVITSDHGHVLDRGTDKQTAPDALSARHRTGTTPAGSGEVVLAGRRVVAPGQRVTALWDTTLRYTNRQAGYHGGAALAEAAIPVLAFAPYGASVPKGWRELGPQQPSWWEPGSQEPVGETAVARPGATAKLRKGAQKTVRKSVTKSVKKQLTAEQRTGQGALLSFDAISTAPRTEISALPAPLPVSAADRLLDDLGASEIMEAQLASLPRPEPFESVATALRALIDAHGILPVSVVAERAGKRAPRAAGFAATLQRVLNYDQADVLALTDNGRSLRLDLALLKRQFGLDGNTA